VVAHINGELVVWDGERLSFEALQRRAISGSRTAQQLAAQMPAYFIAFDALQIEGRELLTEPYDATAARHDHLVEHLKAAGLGALADLGFLGVDKPDDPDDLVIVTGFKATRYRKLTAGQKEANRALAAGRAPVEHGFAHLKNWRIPTKLRTDPARATGLLRALLVLTHLEVAR
jgi:hypothetical protein